MISDKESKDYFANKLKNVANLKKEESNTRVKELEQMMKDKESKD
jgi:hypothetical protein